MPAAGEKQSSQTEIIKIPEQQLPIYDQVDVLVCGGGVAGIAAGVAAARNGSKTLLVERAGFLGGTATGSMMGLIVIPFSELRGFPAEFFTRLRNERKAGAGRVVPWDTEAYKLIAEEVVLRAGAEILYHTWVSEPIIENRKIKGVVVQNKSGRQAILAKVIIDATGDADIAARAGVPFVKGREEDGAMRPVTVMGIIGNVNLRRMKTWIDAHKSDFAVDPGRHVFDLDAGIIRIDGFFSLVEQAKKTGLVPADMPINYLRFSAVFEPGQEEHAHIILNSTRIFNIDGTDARQISRAETEGRRQLKDSFKICKALLPGFENSALIQSSSYLGVRETRRVLGQYVLTYEDIAKGRHFEDSVALMTSVDYGTAEIHGPDVGHEGSADDTWARQMVLDLIRFEFPLRSMLVDKFQNLIVAGRCASFTHDADKFVRNMGPIAQMGQAAGTFAALYAQQNFTGGDLVKALQERLEQAGLPVRQ